MGCKPLPRRGRSKGSSRPRGVVLMEVVFALALFAAGAGTLIGAFTACVRATRQLRVEAQAVDKAVTLLSEIQLGLLPAQDDGPTDFEEPDQDWSWQIATHQLEVQTIGLPTFTQVRILITYKPEGYTYSLVHLVSSSGEEQQDTSAPPADYSAVQGGSP